MRRLTGIWRSALIMTLAMALIVVLFLLGILGYMVLTFKLNVDANFSTNTIDEALVQTADGYEFSAAYALDGKNQWAMLIDDSGDVIYVSGLTKLASISDIVNLVESVSLS